MEFTYKTNGTCAQFIDVEIDQQQLKSVRFVGGCRGNLEGISRLVQGRPVSEVTQLLRGITCRNGTSCADQLARALEEKIRVVV
ncbi:MAG TPA: TIGR03905 family TSCPD domain-containing protein [Geothermobacteraceae bacterium]|nr:TIGR03905 family TSCPD domain-containing protein [Geothermobacteraceae bacterium]